MPIIHIEGRVLPGSSIVNSGKVGSVRWVEGPNASPIRFEIKIVSSLIEIECEVDSYHPNGDHSLLVIRAFQFARCLVDCIAFMSGQGLTIILDHLVEPDGNRKHINFANDKLAELCTIFTIHGANNLAAMFLLVGSEPQLFLALNDLIAAVSTPGLVAINCARAIEGLRTILMPDDETRTRAWEVFLFVLNLERSYADYITEASIAPRHGDKMARPGEALNSKLLAHAWTIMDRFIPFRKGGSERWLGLFEQISLALKWRSCLG